MNGGHGNCCRFATLTGVHQGAHVPCEILGQWRCSELLIEQNDGISYVKNGEVEVVPIVDLSADSAKSFFLHFAFEVV